VWYTFQAFVGLSVCLFIVYVFTRLRCASTAERIEVLYGVETLEDLRKTILDVSRDFSDGILRPASNTLAACSSHRLRLSSMLPVPVIIYILLQRWRGVFLRVKPHIDTDGNTVQFSISQRINQNSLM